MSNINILRQNSQFKKAYTKGKCVAMPEIVVYAKKVNGDGGYGITASKKIGNAVMRNRAKRRLRAVLRCHYESITKGYDIVLVARARTITAKFSLVEKSFLKIAQDLGILKEAEKE